MPSECRVVPCWAKARYLPRQAGADAAGRVLGEIPDVDLPHRAVGDGDIRAVVMQPARWVDSGKIGDHAPPAVHARRSGVGVGGLPAGAPGVEGIGVVAAVLVAGEVDRPEPLPPLFQREGARCRPRRRPAVEVDIHLPGRGCPQPQAGARPGCIPPPAGRYRCSAAQKRHSQTALSNPQVFGCSWVFIPLFGMSFENSVPVFFLIFKPFLAKQQEVHYTEKKHTRRQLWHIPTIGKA